ncbi:acyl-CoA dehydrogenase family protein [Rhodococcus sp. BE178]|uniref:acyl-CoA dehydrogenase family protein n=1 Tax=Rhodococcus sp. BE178 TaxID=2817737 RepID=UPI003D1DA102
MDFSLTEAQNDLSRLTRDLLTSSATTSAVDRNSFDRPLWQAMVRAGLLDAALPAPVGGGFGLLEQCSILIEIGRAVAAVPYLSSVAVAASAVAQFGDSAQVQRWVGAVADGSMVIAPALATEDDRFVAEKKAAGWCLRGSRSVVPSGSFADAFLVEATTEDGSMLVVVDHDIDGVRVSAQHVVDGTDAALLEMEDVTVDHTAVIGTPGDGGAQWAHRRATIATCAYQLGVVEQALELTSDYACTRKQFDKPIGSFQAVRQRLADAYIDVEAIRMTLWQAAWRESEELSADAEIAAAKFWAAEAGHRLAHTVVHVHASIGIFLDYPVHRYFVAAKRAEFALGGATSQLRTLGRMLAQPTSS